MSLFGSWLVGGAKEKVWYNKVFGSILGFSLIDVCSSFPLYGTMKMSIFYFWERNSLQLRTVRFSDLDKGPLIPWASSNLASQQNHIILVLTFYFSTVDLYQLSVELRNRTFVKLLGRCKGEFKIDKNCTDTIEL